MCELTPSLIILGKFAEGVIECFGKEYLRPPRSDELKIPLSELGQYIGNSRKI
jgi:hypothetical protein